MKPQIIKKITRLTIYKGDVDVSDEIEMRNKKQNPFGWSQVELWHNEIRIGWLESGLPDIDAKLGYHFTITEETI